MFKTRRKMSGQETHKKGVLPLLFHPQFNTSLWFMKTRNDAPSVMNKCVRNIGVRSLFKVHHPEGKQTYVSGGKAREASVRRFLRRRSSIEPVIGHMKQEHRLGLNYLGGIEGDKFNPILSASAFNLQKLLRSFALLFFYWLKKWGKFLTLSPFCP